MSILSTYLITFHIYSYAAKKVIFLYSLTTHVKHSKKATPHQNPNNLTVVYQKALKESPCPYCFKSEIRT